MTQRLEADSIPNGPGAAAILAAGTGCFALGLFTLAGDAVPAIRSAFNVWSPTGPLSGISGTAIMVWLVVWLALSRLWRARDINLVRVNVAAFVMLIASTLLMFPPFMDLLQGK